MIETKIQTRVVRSRELEEDNLGLDDPSNAKTGERYVTSGRTARFWKRRRKAVPTPQLNT